MDSKPTLLSEDRDETNVNIKTGRSRSQRRLKKRKILMAATLVLLCIIVIIVIVAIAIALARQKNSPVLLVEPDVDGETKLIKFNQGLPASYEKYSDRFSEVLKEYENRDYGEDVMDCSEMLQPLPDGKSCRFSVMDLGPDCTREREYGFDEGQPCVLLQLEKVENWTPVPYNRTHSPPEEADLGDRWSNKSISVSCEGQYQVDKEIMGPLAYYPPNGFPIIYFPYLNQKEYKSPLVMVKFMKPRNGVLIQVICRAWAQNIDHTKNKEIGNVKFELLID